MRAYGDPALVLTVPAERYATNYVVQMLSSFSQYTIDVVAPTSASVNLDGEPLSGFKPIGNSGYSLRRLSFDKFKPDAPVQHTLSGDVPFGVDVYGYGPYESHWYPAGIQSTR